MTLYRRGGKRLLDVLVAATVLVPAAPVIAAAALLVRLTSRGPVFFRQDRLGAGGKVFTVRKLRTMTHRERVPSAEIAVDDPEVTTVGRFLRRTKIDELPQVVDVLRGRMSLVGPRPALPTQLAELDHVSRRRLDVRPGLTGLAQVNGNVHLSWPERWRYDVWYVDNLSLALDLRILAATIAVVLGGEHRRLGRLEVPS